MQLPQVLTKQTKFLIGICVLLLIPALLINLGLLAVIEDEAIRGLVALEMKYSGNYIVPSINGVPYFHKPPLYNWIILLSYSFFGEVSEFSLRFPTVFFTCMYGYVIYYFFKSELGKLPALTIAFLAITCGRIFFYDSFLGLIDICFSMCMFSLMLGTYQFARKKRWTAMFVLAYSLAAVGFLLKTLPAAVFLVVSLLIILTAEKSIRRLFSKGHALGILIFVLTVGGYYYAYSLDENIKELGPRIVSQSTSRTVIEFGLWKTVQHLFTFPFELIYHFLPWSVLSVYLFRKGAIKSLWNHPFFKVIIMLFLGNIALYWTSPQVYARYLLMFPPLMYAPLFYLHIKNQADNSFHFKIVKYALFAFAGFVIVGSFASLFINRIDFIPFLPIKSALMILLSILGIFFIRHYKRFEILTIIYFIIVLRIGFNLFVLPDRNANDYSDQIRTSSTRIGREYIDENLVKINDMKLNRSVSFYITKEREKQIMTVKKTPENGLLITEKLMNDCIQVDTLKNRNRSKIYQLYTCE